MLIQKISKKTIAISEAISTSVVFPSMYFPSLFVLREISTSNSPQLACVHSVKATCEVYSVDARDQLTAIAYSPKKMKGTQLTTRF